MVHLLLIILSIRKILSTQCQSCWEIALYSKIAYLDNDIVIEFEAKNFIEELFHGTKLEEQ